MHCVRIRMRALTYVLIVSKPCGNTALGIKFLSSTFIYSFFFGKMFIPINVWRADRKVRAETYLILLLKLSLWFDFNQILNVSTCLSERTWFQSE
jgi:hypothetical protein